MYVYIRIYIHIYLYIYVQVYICIHICTYIYVYVYRYIHIYINMLCLLLETWICFFLWQRSNPYSNHNALILSFRWYRFHHFATNRWSFVHPIQSLKICEHFPLSLQWNLANFSQNISHLSLLIHNLSALFIFL
jgi:hypothetical protein